MAVTCCLGIVNLYALRVTLSVAMVAMVNSSYSEANINNITIDECPGQQLDSNTTTLSVNQILVLFKSRNVNYAQ